MSPSEENKILIRIFIAFVIFIIFLIIIIAGKFDYNNIWIVTVALIVHLISSYIGEVMLIRPEIYTSNTATTSNTYKPQNTIDQELKYNEPAATPVVNQNELDEIDDIKNKLYLAIFPYKPDKDNNNITYGVGALGKLKGDASNSPFSAFLPLFFCSSGLKSNVSTCDGAPLANSCIIAFAFTGKCGCFGDKGEIA